MNTKQESSKKLNETGEESIEAVPFFKRKKVLLPALVIVAVTAVLSLILYLKSYDYISTDDAYIDGNKVTVSSKYPGKILKIYVDEGETVRKGQALVRLDDSDLKAQQEQAKSALLYAEKNYNLNVINYSRAADDFNRAEQQYKNNVITKEQFEHTQKTLEASKAQSAIAEAQIGTAKAQLGVINTQLSNSTIYAPMEGVVAKKWVMAGDVVQMSQPILSLYDLKNLWVTANLEETKYAEIHNGEKAVLRMDAYPGKKYTGKIIALGSNTAAQFSLIPPNNAAGNFTKVTQRIPVKISIEGIENNDVSNKYSLIPGMSVEVKLKVK